MIIGGLLFGKEAVALDYGICVVCASYHHTIKKKVHQAWGGLQALSLTHLIYMFNNLITSVEISSSMQMILYHLNTYHDYFGSDSRIYE